MNEDIRLKMGMDSTAVAVGLRGVTGQVKQWAGSIKSSITGAFSGMGASIAGAIGLASLSAQMAKALQLTEQVKLSANALGVGTGFIQDLQNVAKASGLAESSIEKLLKHFIKKLPAGKDVESEFFKFVDQLSKIPDPAKRAQMALAAFGKSGLDVIKIAGEGSEAFKQMASQFDKFADSEIEALQKADAQLDKFGNRITIWAGRAIGNITAFFSAMGKLSATGSNDLFGAIVSNDADAQDAADAAEIARKQVAGIEQVIEKTKKQKATEAKAKKDAIKEEESARKTLYDALEKEHQAAFKKLSIEKQILALVKERKFLMRIADAPGVSDNNRARAVAGFLDVDSQIRDLQALTPKVAPVKTTPLDAWNKRMADKADRWRKAHVGPMGMMSDGRPWWDKSVPVAAKPNAPTDPTALLQAILKSLDETGIKIKVDE